MILIGGFQEDDLAEFRRQVSEQGRQVRAAAHPVSAIEKAASSGVKALVVLLGAEDREWLEFIPVFNHLFPGIPVIVVAAQDSLETERQARQGKIFYYLQIGRAHV